MPSPYSNSRFRVIPIVIAQGFGVACGIAGVKLNSHLLPPDVLGFFGIFLTLAPLGMWVVHAGVVKFVLRHWAGTPARPHLMRQAFSLWGRRLPWLGLLALAGALALTRFGDSSVIVAWGALFPAAALLALGALAQGALQAERAHWRDCGVSMCGSASRTFAPLIAFVLAGGTVQALWAGFGVHALAFAFAGAWALRRYWTTSSPAPETTTLNAAYAGPMFTALATAAWILAGLNRWLVAGFFGETEAGYFTLAGGAAVVLSATLGSVFMQYFQPGFFALGDTAGRRTLLARRVDLAALSYAIVALGVIGAFAYVSPWLVGPLINEQYRDALPWILPAGCFAVATLTTGFYQSLLMAGRREAACGPVELSTAAVLVAGCLASAAVSETTFARWLIVTPLVPWLLTRPLARRHFFG